jgi:hypothetical protein
MTSQQFLFYEMRIVAEKYIEGRTAAEIIEYVKRDNLFQYPTERTISKSVRTCLRRILALGNESLIYEVLKAPREAAKQINLYAIMRYNRLAHDFMTALIGGKYRQQDLSLTKKDINVFFMQISQLHDSVAAWREPTIMKLKQVLVRCLVETEMLDSVRDTALNPVLISPELESGIRENKDLTALAAFNCFR